MTVKQKTFAANVAAGLPKTEAYRKAYNTKMVGSGVRVDAARQSRKPVIKSEIERLTLLQLPQAEDAYALRMHARASLVDLAKRAVSEDVRMKSAMYLDSIASATIQARAEPPGETRSAVLADLRVMYQRAMRVAPKTLEMEAEPLTVTATASNSEALENATAGPEAIGEQDAPVTED